MISIVALIMLGISVMLIFFKKDILNKNTSLNRIWETSGFVVCIISLIVIYVTNR